jgi:hypothetical protein
LSEDADRVDIGANAQLRERVFGVERPRSSRTLGALADRPATMMTRRANQVPIAPLHTPSRSIKIVSA